MLHTMSSAAPKKDESTARTNSILHFLSIQTWGAATLQSRLNLAPVTFGFFQIEGDEAGRMEVY